MAIGVVSLKRYPDTNRRCATAYNREMGVISTSGAFQTT